MYIFDFKQRYLGPCMGHFFIVRNENVPYPKKSISDADVRGMKGFGYELVYGGQYGNFFDISELCKSLQEMNGEEEKYNFRKGDVLILVAGSDAYAYVLCGTSFRYINKNIFAEECAKNFGNVHFSWGNRNVLFSACTCECNGKETYDGYAVEVYDDKDRQLISENRVSIFQNWFVIFDQALKELLEPVYDDYYHNFFYRTAGVRDNTTLVPDKPGNFFYFTDGSFIGRSVLRMKELQKEHLTADVHRKAMQERYKDRTITPDIIEDIALSHIMQEFSLRADEPISVHDVIFHSFNEPEHQNNSGQMLATVVVEYDSKMTEMYVHDLLCVRSCSYTKGTEKVYVEFVPVRKEQTGTFSDYLNLTKTGVSREKLKKDGIKTLFKEQEAYIITPRNDKIKDEMLLPVYDADGMVLGSVVVYSPENPEEVALQFEDVPLLFAEIGGEKELTNEQRFNLIELFDGWYEEQKPFGFADEFPMAVNMLASMKTRGAVLINTRHIAFNEEFYDVLGDILWPEEQKTDSTERIPFWIGCVEHETGKILEVHSHEEAMSYDYHPLYFTEENLIRMDKHEVSLFWIRAGEIDLDDMTVFDSEEERTSIIASIEKQICVVSFESAVLAHEGEKEKIEHSFRELAEKLLGEDKSKPSSLWNELMEQWNELALQDLLLAKRICEEYEI